MDIKISNCGSLILFHLLTDAANTWVDENVEEPRQFMGNALGVGPRYASELLEGMLEAGLTVDSR